MEAKPIKKPEEKEQSNQKYNFQVKYVPKGIFQLFNKNDTYIYEKKFCCDLPKNIIPPKSFHYPFSLENYCQSDLLTMDFDLKKNPEILTDSKINTLIHQDFINNTLELIFPKLTTITKKRSEEEQKFKKKILEIIERNDEVNQDNNPELNIIPDFLRRQTYLRPSTVVNTDNKSKLKDLKDQKKPTTVSELKNSIEQSFNEIDKIKEGSKHPDSKRKGVVAKKVYELAPMDDMSNVTFIEYLFPSDPSKVINLDEKYLTPEKFLIKMNKANDISDETTCSFYINNKLKTQAEQKEKDTAEYYSYETDFTSNKINEGDLFNRYFFILDKVSKKLKISRLTDKFTLRGYKRIMEEDEIDENTNKIIGKKRRRNIITVPRSMQKEEFDKKKKWISDRGYNTRLMERKIESVDHSLVMEIEKEKQLEEENRKKQKENEEEEENVEGEGENIEDDEDIFNEEENEEQNENDNEEYLEDNNENEGENQQNDEDNEENEENNNNEEENNEEVEHNEEQEDKDKKEEQDDLDDENGEDVFD